MRIKEIAFTGYPVTDMRRARDFYEGVLGLTLSRQWGEADKPSWIEYDIGEACLAIVADEDAGWPPANAGPAAALEVDDFQAYVDKLKASGVTFQWEPQESKICWMAVVLDPDRNRLVIHHRKND
jgi:predicted enzyme related to lactoylglutathione lyase